MRLSRLHCLKRVTFEAPSLDYTGTAGRFTSDVAMGATESIPTPPPPPPTAQELHANMQQDMREWEDKVRKERIDEREQTKRQKFDEEGRKNQEATERIRRERDLEMARQAAAWEALPDDEKRARTEEKLDAQEKEMWEGIRRRQEAVKRQHEDKMRQRREAMAEYEAKMSAYEEECKRVDKQNQKNDDWWNDAYEDGWYMGDRGGMYRVTPTGARKYGHGPEAPEPKRRTYPEKPLKPGERAGPARARARHVSPLASG